MGKQDIVYFELNNWFSGRDYPDAEPFLSWMQDDSKIIFANDEWAKANKLVVSETLIDMSLNYCITAPREWVEKNCPELLTKYTEFLRIPEEEGELPESRFDGNGPAFLPYEEQYFGVTYVHGTWDD